MDKRTELIKKRYNRLAKYYDNVFNIMEKKMIEKWRYLVWKDVKGRVLEVGVGTGKNIPYYPENIEVTAIDFSEEMISIAKKRAKELNKKVEFRVMDVQNLEFDDQTFDVIVSTCVFCSVPDPIKGLKEVRRVCKKDGFIVMIEHVRSKKPIIGRIMDILNPLVVFMYGANINRDTVNNMKSAGIDVVIEEDLWIDIFKFLKGRP